MRKLQCPHRTKDPTGVTGLGTLGVAELCSPHPTRMSPFFKTSSQNGFKFQVPSMSRYGSRNFGAKIFRMHKSFPPRFSKENPTVCLAKLTLVQQLATATKLECPHGWCSKEQNLRRKKAGSFAQQKVIPWIWFNHPTKTVVLGEIHQW